MPFTVSGPAPALASAPALAPESHCALPSLCARDLTLRIFGHPTLLRSWDPFSLNTDARASAERLRHRDAQAQEAPNESISTNLSTLEAWADSGEGDEKFPPQGGFVAGHLDLLDPNAHPLTPGVKPQSRVLGARATPQATLPVALAKALAAYDVHVSGAWLSASPSVVRHPLHLNTVTMNYLCTRTSSKCTKAMLNLHCFFYLRMSVLRSEK